MTGAEREAKGGDGDKMKSSSWTPGPWVVKISSDGRPYIMGQGVTIAKTYRSAVRITHGEGESALVDLPGLINARLITAAPDMASVLDEIISAEDKFIAETARSSDNGYMYGALHKARLLMRQIHGDDA